MFVAQSQVKNKIISVEGKTPQDILQFDVVKFFFKS